MSTALPTTAELQGRARRLRAQAASLHPLVAETYRRRAAELDFEALLEAVWNPPIDMGDAPVTDEPQGVEVRAAPLHLAVA
jgi:hypothetical protein